MPKTWCWICRVTRDYLALTPKYCPRCGTPVRVQPEERHSTGLTPGDIRFLNVLRITAPDEWA